MIAQWFANIFSRDLGELGIYYSPVRKAFVARPVASQKGASNPLSSGCSTANLGGCCPAGAPPSIQWEADWYTDLNELRALVTLVRLLASCSVAHEVLSRSGRTVCA